MNGADKERVEQFLGSWLGTGGNERANYQGFFLDLCRALNVEGPPPKGSNQDDPYCFDKDIKTYSGDKTAPTTRFADFYKADHFLIEAKQGSTDSSKGHGKRGTKAYRDVMQKAFNQAKSYTGSLASRPPFLMTCDIGSHFEVWEGFSGEYGSYGARQRLNLKDLADADVFDRFVKIFTDPQALNPAKLRARVTREVAAELAKLSRWLEDAGHDAQATASFLMRCIFTMFAEDVGLLKEEVFTKALRDRWIPQPSSFQGEIEELWQTMNTGGRFGYDHILKFNGSFFEDATAFALPKAQLEVLYAAAAKDWSLVEPAIFGTLVERALEKKERSRLGAHYTPRSYVERLVRPVVMEPLRQEWDEVELEIKRLLEPVEIELKPSASQEDIAKAKAKAEKKQTENEKAVEREIRTFLTKLRKIKILDPACGTGNFLYVSLDLLKGLEQEVIKRLVDVVGEVQLGFEQINPSQFLGIEINPRAAAIAELVIWIGYLQWYFKRYGNAEPPEPVLQAFGNIECRDAVLAYDGKVPDVDGKTGKVKTHWSGLMMTHPVTLKDIPDMSDQVVSYRYSSPRPAKWPQTDYVVSNPPFLGKLYLYDRLGDGYIDALRKAYANEVPDGADFVMYWWYCAAKLTQSQSIQSFGFITTSSISQSFNRRVVRDVLQAKKPISLVFAIPDHPWTDTEGSASVRIAMTAARSGERIDGILKQVVFESGSDIDSKIVEFEIDRGLIHENLKIGVNVTTTTALKQNSLLCSTGLILGSRGFVLERKDSLSFRNSEKKSIVFPLYNGNDITDRPRNVSVIDTYQLTEKHLMENYPAIYQRLKNEVYPERQSNRDPKLRKNWWLFRRTNEQVRSSVNGIGRYIATSETSKHRVFVFLSSEIKPEHKLVVVGTSDSFILGVLSSQVHVTWALESGSKRGVTPVYPKTRCFDPFPFPDPPAEQKQKIRELGDRLDTHRKQVQAAHPEITITGMYNLLEKLRAGQPFTDTDRAYNNKALVSTLKQIHDDLDLAVLDAYGWPHNITHEQILENLVALNAQRAEEERNGLIRWLRPEYQSPGQAPDQALTQQPTLEGIITEDEPIVIPAVQQPWPTQPKAQLAAIRDLLRTTPGEWSTKQIAAQFKGNITQKKLEAITENLERLEWFGLIIRDDTGNIPHWHYAESTQSA